MNSKLKKIAVAMGGVSSERPVSLKSGTAVLRALIQAGYDAFEFDITDTNPILPDGADAVFITLHGAFGEDGQVQKLFDDLLIPYTGSGAASSRLAFDKAATKDVLVKHQISTPAYTVLREVPDTPPLPLPLVVKPLLQGSSFGVHRVFNESEWRVACTDALSYDKRVLVEGLIEGKELTVGIVSDTVLPVLEIKAPGGCYDYNAKYTVGTTEYIVPAKIEDSLSELCKTLAWDTYNALGCRGLGRVDIMLDTEGHPFVLELNTIPGFTETSLLPKAALAAGISFVDLCKMIIDLARFGA
ncbi:MAG: D-alanine--D-alanine ligase [Lentisphaerae bacterium]|nr:D-alanine--D-alanine ligase [Lentisphaerota bacterium]